MAKKQKSKTRLDKYYYLAKDHGFRSRATFKLIQLNKKYNFFANSNVCIDLCAAPGGWLQAASKFMPISSLKVGVDLVPIKAIPGCSTIVSDITTQDCRIKLDKELKHMKADIVLNDGAPNVGGNWNFDAFTQSELVLYAVKLASEFLKVGGWFVTKVFRSSDYSSLIYVMQQLFNKVEATKPLASRQVSAEIFVVCQGFKGGDIDSKLLDPKYALKQLEDEEDMKLNSIKSIKGLLEASTGRHRSGYYDSTLYKVKEFSEFIETPNPYQFFYEVNKVSYSTDKSKNYLEMIKKPTDWNLLLEDTKVLGKTELQLLINWREKIRVKAKKILKKEEGITNEDKNLTKEQYKAKRMEEIEEEIQKIEKAKKKRLLQNEKKKEKNELRQKISFIKENEEAGGDGTNFDQALFDELKRKKINIEQLAIDNAGVEEDEESDDQIEGVEQIELSDFSEEDYYEMMNEHVEDHLHRYKEDRDEKSLKKQEQKENKKMKKKKTLDELSDIEEDNQIVVEKDGEDNEEGEEDDINTDEYDEEDEDDDFADDDDLDEEDEDDSDIEERLNKTEAMTDGSKTTKESKLPGFINPLKSKGIIKPSNRNDDTAKTATKIEEENNQSSDSEDEGKDKTKQDLLNKKRKRTEAKNQEIENADIEFVERENPNDSEYDSDEIAEIRALAKKMLRKKDRLKIFDSSYNRYAFSDLDNAPDWFREDEVKHNRPSKPITKEEIMAERELLKKINDRMPKKVLEAKNRKKKRLARQMEKVKKKAQVIANQEEIGEGSKMRQIEKLYKKELNKNKEEKKYVVVRSKQKVGKNSRNVKYVDKRLKKDKRGQKRAERRNKTKGKNQRTLAKKNKKANNKPKGVGGKKAKR